MIEKMLNKERESFLCKSIENDGPRCNSGWIDWNVMLFFFLINWLKKYSNRNLTFVAEANYWSKKNFRFFFTTVLGRKPLMNDLLYRVGGNEKLVTYLKYSVLYSGRSFLSTATMLINYPRHLVVQFYARWVQKVSGS